MRKREIGQALPLVLILLAIGALLVVPSLRLGATSSQSGQVVERHTKGLYAADAAQEYVLWKLLWGDLAGDLMQSYDPQEPDPSVHYDFDVCGVPVGVTVVMRAIEGEGGTILATEDKIKPVKEVTPSYLAGSSEELYTYTISLDYISDISDENPKVYLDAIYDLPPGGFGSGAYEGPTELSLDGGETWLLVPDPEWNHAKGYLKWPADYEWDPVVSGAFSSHPEFLGIEDFEEREVKMLRFKMRGTLTDNNVHCNWVVLKMEDGTNTLSGPQAPITVGNPANPGECEDDSVLAVTKISNPEIIPPDEPTPVEYIISITNMYTQTRHIQEVTDYLPPGFLFDSARPVSGITEELPTVTLETINGIERYKLTWTIAEFPGDNAVNIQSDETLTLTFWAEATEDVSVSGSYYNEVLVFLTETGLPSQGFAEAGVSTAEFGSNYSWLTGAVIVPAYDSQSDAEGVTIDANMALILGGITINSWQVY
jgi:hypothetical protein